MAGFNPKALLVPGINVANRGVVANLPRKGFTPASGGEPTGHLSFTQHVQYPDADMDTAKRQRPDMGAAAAERAGRSGYSAGVLRCRRLARFAKRTIHYGWASFGRAVTAIKPGDPGKVTACKVGSRRSGHTRIPPVRLLPSATISWSALQGTQPVGERTTELRSVRGVLRSAARGK